MSETPWLDDHHEPDDEEQEIPEFRLVFTLVASLEGFSCQMDETVEIAQLELALEVQNLLNDKLIQLNEEHELDLGVIDFQTRSIPQLREESS